MILLDDAGVHQLECCQLPEYYYSDCNTFSSSYGIGIDCRDHGENLVMEGQCHSGHNDDCHGNFNQVTCCQGHYQGQLVGPTNECTWEYTGFGVQLECGRSDEIIVGRCGSGSNEG